jgi:hypothetical protein
MPFNKEIPLNSIALRILVWLRFLLLDTRRRLAYDVGAFPESACPTGWTVSARPCHSDFIKRQIFVRITFLHSCRRI